MTEKTDISLTVILACANAEATLTLVTDNERALVRVPGLAVEIWMTAMG